MGEAQLERPFREDLSRAAICWPYLPSYSRFAFPHGDVDDMLALEPQEPLQVIDVAHPRLVDLQQHVVRLKPSLSRRSAPPDVNHAHALGQPEAGCKLGRERLVLRGDSKRLMTTPQTACLPKDPQVVAQKKPAPRNAAPVRQTVGLELFP